MNQRNHPSLRGFTQPFSGQQQSLPGGPDPFSFGGNTLPAGNTVPFNELQTPAVSQNLPVLPGQSAAQSLQAVTGAGKAGGGILSMANLTEIKSLIDRMGGLDGIVNSVGKVQKLVSGFQQMSPMIKLLLGSFGKKGAVAHSDHQWPKKRRRKRRRPSGSSKSGTRPRSKKTGASKRRTKRR